MTYRINYHGINSFITDADSLLHPMYFWEKEKYENGKLNFLPTKLTNIIKTEYSEVAKNIDNKRFLGTGIAILNYINSTFEVLETDILFKTYGYHDVRVINESISETKSRVTFYYTKNNYDNLSRDQLNLVGKRWPRIANINKHIDVYYSSTFEDLKNAFSLRSKVPATENFKVKTFIGIIYHEYNTNNINIPLLINDINTQLEKKHELCNIYMNTFIERNWIPTHKDMIYPNGSYFYGINGINIILSTPSLLDKDYDVEVINDKLQTANENTIYYGDIPILRKMKEYINSYIDKNTFYYKYKKYENVLNFSLSTNFIKIATDRFISVGHCKIDYQFALNTSILINEDNFISRLISQIDETTRVQNNYIYTMFIFEVNRYGIITKISDMFIPVGNGIFNSYINFRAAQQEENNASKYFLNNTNNNPYLLVFPVGLTLTNNNSVFISFGEGDCRPKIIELSLETIELLLNNVDSISKLSFLYINDSKKPDIESICIILPDICKNEKQYLTLNPSNFIRHLTLIDRYNSKNNIKGAGYFKRTTIPIQNKTKRKYKIHGLYKSKKKRNIKV